MLIQFLPGVRPLPQSLAAHLYTRILMLFPAKETPASAQSAALAEHALCTYGQSILRLAYSYLRNQSDAEDILQETLVRLLRSAPEFETQEHEKAWLLHVAANLSKNRLRYNRLRRADPLEETLIAQERPDLAFVWEAVSALPVRWREVLHLYYQEEYSTAEIAQILSRKESTVRSDLRRARIRLKEVLQDDYDLSEGL